MLTTTTFVLFSLAIVILIVDRIAAENRWHEQRTNLEKELAAWKLAAHEKFEK